MPPAPCGKSLDAGMQIDAVDRVIAKKCHEMTDENEVRHGLEKAGRSVRRCRYEMSSHISVVLNRSRRYGGEIEALQGSQIYAAALSSAGGASCFGPAPEARRVLGEEVAERHRHEVEPELRRNSLELAGRADLIDR